MALAVISFQFDRTFVLKDWKIFAPRSVCIDTHTFNTVKSLINEYFEKFLQFLLSMRRIFPDNS